MNCPRCDADLPDVAHFCHVCGQDVRSADQARRRSFAVKPDEPVASFALISTIMPRGAAAHPQTYRIALTIALVVALVAAIFGALPIAILVAAFAIPIVYIVYLYDVNLWEDEPLPVTGLAFGLTGLLTIVFMIIVELLRGPDLRPRRWTARPWRRRASGRSCWLAVLVPIVGEAIRQVGPLLLASRPEFDDLMDGLTFGVISGVAFACFDTIVRYWDLLTGGIVEPDPGLWVSLIFLHGFVKPLLIGTATGIACAEYSGLGRGYDGFTPRYYAALAVAVVANIAFWAGVYLFAFVGDDTLSVVLSLGWGLLILGILILRLRNVLHVGLMEAALERSARAGGVGADGELDVCARCEMPLLDHAAFCNACGTAVRVQDKAHRVKAVPARGSTTPSVGQEGPAAAGWPPEEEAGADLAARDEDTVGLSRPLPPPDEDLPPSSAATPDPKPGARRARGGPGMSQNPPPQQPGWSQQGGYGQQPPQGGTAISRRRGQRPTPQQPGYGQQPPGYPNQPPPGGYATAGWLSAQNQPGGLPAAGPGPGGYPPQPAGRWLPTAGWAGRTGSSRQPQPPQPPRPASKKSPALIIGIVVAAVVLLAAVGGIIMALTRGGSEPVTTVSPSAPTTEPTTDPRRSRPDPTEPTTEPTPSRPSRLGPRRRRRPVSRPRRPNPPGSVTSATASA